jgi:hypothetical protein
LFARLDVDRHIMARLADDLRGRGFDALTTDCTFRNFLHLSR